MMGDTAFTPGPWVLLHTDDGHLIRMGTFLQSGRKAPHHEVAYCHGLFIDDDYPTAQDEFAEAEANANLIAAAPDLYEALMAVVREFGDSKYPEWVDAIAVLAKARGEVA